MKDNIYILLSSAETYLSKLDTIIKHEQPGFMKECALATRERAEHYEAYRDKLIEAQRLSKEYLSKLRAEITKASIE